MSVLLLCLFVNLKNCQFVHLRRIFDAMSHGILALHICLATILLRLVFVFVSISNDGLQAEKYQSALGKYRRAVGLLEHEENLEGEQKEKRRALLLATHLNMALCHLKLNDTLEAVKACNKALELEPRSEKAYFRRGQAYVGCNEFDMARKDFEEVLKIDANNKAARNQLSICMVKLKQQLQKEKQMYKQIFERMAAQAQANAPPTATKEPGSQEPLEPGVWNRSDENNQEAATPEESKTAAEAEEKNEPPPPESVPASS
uniref:peptidylprolyl isomerase n=1 Tax=Amblyomma triste TaxID=251400 RepID=A0A023G5T5_AMBTT